MPRKKRITETAAEERIRPLLMQWLSSMLLVKRRMSELQMEISRNSARELTQEQRINLGFQFQQLENWKKEYEKVEAAFEELTRMTSEVLSDAKATQLERARLFCRIFLRSYRSWFSGLNQLEEASWMTDEELEELVNLGTTLYLEQWLEKDRKVYLSIGQFVRCGYKDMEPKDHNQGLEAAKAAYHRAYEVYRKMHYELQAQKKERCEVPHPVDYKTGRTRPLSLPTLAWCRAFVDGDIEILQTLFFSKFLLNRKSAHNAAQNEKLGLNLKRYVQFLEKVKSDFPAEEADTAQCKEYVANCILIQMLERHYHWSLPAVIAEHAIERNLAVSSCWFRELVPFIIEHWDEDWIFVGSKELLDKEGLREHEKLYPSCRILGLSQIARQIMDFPKRSMELQRKERLQRYAMDNLIAMMSACCPIGRKTWKDADFVEAARFLGKEYRVLEKLLEEYAPIVRLREIAGKEKSRAQRFYDGYCAYYLWVRDHEGSLVRRNIGAMK